MKFVVLHGHGLATGPLSELNGRSPLQVATTPSLDRVAMEGELGSVLLPGGEGEGGSDMTELAVLGYDPRKYHAGRGAFEAAGLGVVLGEHDVAYQCTMVTLRGPTAGGAGAEIKKLSPQVLMEDAQAGGIETEEARELIDSVNESLGSETLQFYPGSRSRHVMVWVDGKMRAVCADPAKVVGRSIGEFLPSGDGADFLKQVMDAAFVVLRDHPVNEERRQAGKKPANCLWLWGQGRTPLMPKLADRFQISGVVISESDLHRGIGLCAGLEAVPPERLGGGGTVAEATLRELEKKDFAYVRVGPRREDTGEKDGKAVVQAAEEFDRTVVGPLLEGLARTGPFRLLVICEPLSAAGSEQGRMAPYAMLASEGRLEGTRRFTEADAAATKTVVRDLTRLLPKLFAQGKAGSSWH